MRVRSDRFTLADGLIVVAILAVGFGLGRLYPVRTNEGLTFALAELFLRALPLGLLGASIGYVMWGCSRRPWSRRRLFRGYGMACAGAVLVIAGIYAIQWGIYLLRLWFINPTYATEIVPRYARLSSQQISTTAVLVTMMLFVMRIGRNEQTWFDRVGRVLAGCWWLPVAYQRTDVVIIAGVWMMGFRLLGRVRMRGWGWDGGLWWVPVLVAVAWLGFLIWAVPQLQEQYWRDYQRMGGGRAVAAAKQDPYRLFFFRLADWLMPVYLILPLVGVGLGLIACLSWPGRSGRERLAFGGMVSLASILGYLALAAGLYLVAFLVPGLTLTMPHGFGIAMPFFEIQETSSERIGCAVVGLSAVLFLGKRLRRGRRWEDQAGRVLGWLWGLWLLWVTVILWSIRPI